VSRGKTGCGLRIAGDYGVESGYDEMKVLRWFELRFAIVWLRYFQNEVGNLEFLRQI